MKNFVVQSSVNFGFAVVAFVVAGFGFFLSFGTSKDPNFTSGSFWAPILLVMAVAVLLLAVWLVVDHDVIPSKLARAVILVTLFVVDAVIFGFGIKLDWFSLTWSKFGCGLGTFSAIAALTGLFLLRKKL